MTVQVSTTTLCVLTFAEDPAVVERLSMRMETFARKHTCRAIVLDGSGSHREERTTANAVSGPERMRGDSDVTRIGVKDMSAPELHALVHDLTTMDVPCALFWAGKRVADDRFESLASLVRNIVLDSSRSSSDDRVIHDVAELDPAKHAKLSDLAYLRLSPWQDMVAQFFDDPLLAHDLPGIRSVDLVTGSDAEAYYLAGWLGSRLDWQPCGRIEFCNAAGERIEISMRREGEARRVRSIVLKSAASTYCAELDGDSPDLVCLTVKGAHARDTRCAPLHDVDLVSLVEQALLAPAVDAVFADTLQMVRSLFSHAPPS